MDDYVCERVRICIRTATECENTRRAALSNHEINSILPVVTGCLSVESWRSVNKAFGMVNPIRSVMPFARADINRGR